ncbi:PEP/pyruvate-binding domain-containing protein [Paenibacillus sp. NPDC056579]|uniref:PEP/pyruvate-binding domain-containing protein n=1 Tax=Paenibacillus sp. NPDC056579 TaxID=3345871 RepID=UPI00368F4998
MEHSVVSFQEIRPEQKADAGGKGGMLSVLYQSGYPVPEGFVILPPAFDGDKLLDSAWEQVLSKVNAMRSGQRDILLAVRSSALSEDSAHASFAGEFETVLQVRSNEELMAAIDKVHESAQSERVKVYSSVQGIDAAHAMAIVVQRMIRSELSGVLFTADPITGSHTRMVGNYVHGLGEQLVSGESDAHAFVLTRPKGIYEGPAECKKHATALYAYASRMEAELGAPQDIEWAAAEGKLYILQARPITTLMPGNKDTYEWNDSLDGDFLWTNTNIGEAIPDVMTPLTWSVLRFIDEEQNIIPGYYIWSGNICGRAYTNISAALSLFPAVGVPIKLTLRKVSQALGQVPEGMTIPVYPFPRLQLLKEVIVKLTRFLKKLRKAAAYTPHHIESSPERCADMTLRIRNISSKQELLALWKEQLRPYVLTAWWSLLWGGRKYGDIAYALNKKLTKLVGTEDTNLLLSNLRGSSGLASLGPVTGIAQVLRGDLSREQYLRQHGHRGPHELELSIPHPAEDTRWLDQQIEEYHRSATDVDALLAKQQRQYEEAWRRFEQRHPGQAARVRKQLAKASANAQLRESARSEFIRVYRVMRAFLLRAGELTALGDDLFFLYIEEVLDVLSDHREAVQHIPARRMTYNQYLTLPPLPTLIRGRFDPFRWAEDPNRRVDYYDATLPVAVADDAAALHGFAGAAGRIEGSVRVLSRPEDGAQLLPGEILVASTTNVGWTPLFPRAAAIITDVGAPLSHAAIVARELGIPAVVGCGNATARLRTGDRVIVDGGQGVVEIVDHHI